MALGSVLDGPRFMDISLFHGPIPFSQLRALIPGAIEIVTSGDHAPPLASLLCNMELQLADNSRIFVDLCGSGLPLSGSLGAHARPFCCPKSIQDRQRA